MNMKLMAVAIVAIALASLFVLSASMTNAAPNENYLACKLYYSKCLQECNSGLSSCMMSCLSIKDDGQREACKAGCEQEGQMCWGDCKIELSICNSEMGKIAPIANL